jgi:hypothetical protein
MDFVHRPSSGMLNNYEEKTTFRKVSLFSSSGKWRKTSTLFGPLERANFVTPLERANLVTPLERANFNNSFRKR